MSKQKKTAGKTAHINAATAAIANHTPRADRRLRSTPAGFAEYKHHCDVLFNCYNEAFHAINEYGQAFMAREPRDRSESRHKRLWDLGGDIGNCFSCCGHSWLSGFSREMLEIYRAEGEELGGGIPAEVVQGLLYVRHNLPDLFGKLVRFDKALPGLIPLDGSAFSSSALLMRAALALAA